LTRMRENYRQAHYSERMDGCKVKNVTLSMTAIRRGV
jgi:hypothetical protein